MDISFVQDNLFIISVAAGLLVGLVVKLTPPLEKFASLIPLLVAVVGAVVAVFSTGFTVEALIYGGLSGLASTGLHQLFKQTYLFTQDNEE